MNPNIKSVSYSLIKRYEKCPFEIYLDRGEREPKPVRGEDHPLTRGTRIHEEVELYIKGEGPFTTALKHHQELIDGYKERYATGNVECEPEWYFNESWEVVNKGAHVWVIKPDLIEKGGNNLDLRDWKSGKSFGKEVSHGEQIQLYSISAFMKYPELTVVGASPVYLDEKTAPRIRAMVRPAVAALLPRWQKRADKLLDEREWKPKPNRSNCKYCDYGIVSGNGKCAYAVGV